MNWIILLFAGLFEVSLNVLLGKSESSIRNLVLSVGERFPCFHHSEHGFSRQGGADFAFGHGLRHLDRHRGSGYGFDRDIRFQGTSHSHQAFLPLHAHCFLDWIEDCVILKKRGEK